jgi:hypothetical protein
VRFEGLSVSDGSSLGSSVGSSLTDSDAVGFGAASSSEEELDRAKIASKTTPAMTRNKMLDEFFFVGALEEDAGLLATGVVVVAEVVPREGTGGITIFVASTPAGGLGSAFFIGRLVDEDFLTEDFFTDDLLEADFFVVAFLATAFFALFFVAGRFAPDFFAALFFAGRAAFFLVATLAPSTLEVSLTSPARSLLVTISLAWDLVVV